MIDNPSIKLKNVKPVVGKKKGMPMVYFMAIRDIVEDEEILYDYGDILKFQDLIFHGCLNRECIVNNLKNVV